MSKKSENVAGLTDFPLSLSSIFKNDNVLCLIGVDIQTGEVILRNQFISLSHHSSWLIVGLFYLEKDYEMRVKKACDRIQQHIDHELLELEY